MAVRLNLVGQVFHRWTVLALDPIRKGNATCWICQCSCVAKSIRSIPSSNLTRGGSKSCGCLRDEIAHAYNFNDLTGQVFGRLTVLKIDKIIKLANGASQIRWLCRCIEGNVVSVAACHLPNGHTKSCGCWRRDNSSQQNSTHHLSGTWLYDIWCGMKARCDYKKHQSYKNYGGRGITVCDEWQANFLKFKDWYDSQPHAYEKGYTLDRIDFNGNYEPSNCQLATAQEQAANQRTSLRNVEALQAEIERLKQTIVTLQS